MFVEFTFIPVLVASLTASTSLSYFGLKVKVNAQSIIRPKHYKQQLQYYIGEE